MDTTGIQPQVIEKICSLTSKYHIRKAILMKEYFVLLEPPFTDRGSVAEMFTDVNVWLRIRKVIEQINTNAVA